jgi:N-acetyltransferase
MSIDVQPTLVGKTLTLRPMASSDFEELYRAASDPLIWDQHPFPRYEKAAFTEFFDQSLETKSALVILDRQTNKIVGASRYYNLQEDSLAIGYTFLARSHWGGRYNRELKTLMLEHAFKFVDKVFFDIGETNLRSRRAIEKIGALFVKLQVFKEKPYTLYEINEKVFRLKLGE